MQARDTIVYDINTILRKKILLYLGNTRVIYGIRRLEAPHHVLTSNATKQMRKNDAQHKGSILHSVLIHAVGLILGLGFTPSTISASPYRGSPSKILRRCFNRFHCC